MEAPIPTPADSDERFMIKFLNAQSIALFEIQPQLYQVVYMYKYRRSDLEFKCRQNSVNFFCSCNCSLMEIGKLYWLDNIFNEYCSSAARQVT